jgi:hypothetical protein
MAAYGGAIAAWPFNVIRKSSIEKGVINGQQHRRISAHRHGVSWRNGVAIMSANGGISGVQYQLKSKRNGG